MPGGARWCFDEFFFLELGLVLKRRGVVLERGIPFEVRHRYTKPLAAMLPYRLTDAQRRVLGEIKRDIMAPHPMNRLLQGDVGSGKTIVALMAALVAVENATQVAVVAPTEILAEQHYLQFHRWLEQLGLRAALLSGSVSTKAKRELLEQIRSGAVHLVVGYPCRPSGWRRISAPGSGDHRRAAPVRGSAAWGASQKRARIPISW